MQWSPQQDRALNRVAEWVKDRSQQVFYIGGYAGTGKTTLARHFGEGIEGEVLSGAYTGKAAHVLRKKGFTNATTIHSLIYHTAEKSRARVKMIEANLLKLRQELRENQHLTDDEIQAHPRIADLQKLLDEERRSSGQPMFSLNHDSAVKDAALVVIDECSMVDDQMGRDLLSFGTKVLVLGDPAQLPPVAGAGFFTERHPDIMLDEIHRQAADSPIIAMATRVRRGESLSLGEYGSSRVIPREKLSAEIALAADQLIVGRNVTRNSYNDRMRQLLGRSGPLPEKGDRLVCLRNNHELGLLNGAIWYAQELLSSDGEKCVLTVRPEDGGDTLDVCAHEHYFFGRGKELPWWERKEAEEFDHGYALTCHKSQGSQWDSTVVINESGCFRQDASRWLYTAVTRAADRVIVAN